MTEPTTGVQTYTQPVVDEQERLCLLSNYHPQDHLVKWVSRDRNTGIRSEVVYYPASWRLYELNLRYPTANFSSDINMMDLEKDFVVVRARLYLGTSCEDSPKRAEAHKQGKLTELDKVETRAKARAARDYGIGTEHALDMDDDEATLVEATSPAPSGNAKHPSPHKDSPFIPPPNGAGLPGSIDKAGNWHQPAKQGRKQSAHTVEQVKISFLSVYKDETKWERHKTNALCLPVLDERLSEK